jgi:tRNA-dihydrouridine synthase
MIDAAGYARSETYRKQFPFVPEDRPLIVQLGGSNPADLAAAAALAAPFCDGVELNIGCPQRCARKAGALPL